MSKKENSALTDQSSNAPLTNNSTNTSLPQKSLINQAPKQNSGDGGLKKRSWDKKKCKCLAITARVYSVAIKIYDEQLIVPLDKLFEIIRNTDPNDFQILAIVHDRDTYVEDGSFWRPAIEKRHIHIIFRCFDRKKRIVVGSLLKQLGIYFRPELDDWLWSHHGVETVNNFSAYATYLTHETEQAIADGKELYDLSEIVSNLSIEEIEQVRNGYIRLAEGSKKVTTKDLVELDNTAYKLGYELQNFSKWYDTLSFNVRSHSKMKTVRESYERGVNARIEENSEVLRLCVFIKGEPNTGKTYGAKKALAGKAIHTVEGGGSGKFDNLRADHDAIIISDDVCPNLLNMSDNYICRAYKRQSNNPAWSGAWFIVTSNLSFADWLKECKINVNGNHYQALLSRFYICEIKPKDDGTNYLALKSASDRGSVEEQKKRAEMFMDFQKKFNETMSGYRPSAKTFDYSDMIDDVFKEKAKSEEEAKRKADYDKWCEQLFKWHYDDLKTGNCPIVPIAGQQNILIPCYEVWLNYTLTDNYKMLHTVIYKSNRKEPLTTYHG